MNVVTILINHEIFLMALCLIGFDLTFATSNPHRTYRYCRSREKKRKNTSFEELFGDKSLQHIYNLTDRWKFVYYHRVQILKYMFCNHVIRC